jgi:solute carrier family 39 (zinc transporter), member 1/2/3
MRHCCVAALVSTASCGEGDGADCRDEAAALRLRTAAVALILAASAAGVAVPLAGRERCLGSTFPLIKAFSAGVVLATGFVHVLSNAEKALSDPCIPDAPWRRFPFAGFVAMLAALGTLAADLVCTQFYERKLRRVQQVADDASEQHLPAALLLDSVTTEARRLDGTTDDDMHVAGTSAQGSTQTSRHGHGEATRDARGHVHGHGHGEEPSLARRVVIAQVTRS